MSIKVDLNSAYNPVVAAQANATYEAITEPVQYETVADFTN